MFDSISQLKEVDSLYKTWFSIYPLLYHELNFIEEKTFEFYNKDIAKLFLDIKRGNNNSEVIKKYIFNLQNIFDYFKNHLDRRKNLLSDDNLIEFFNTFFIWNKITKQEVYKARFNYLEKSYNNEFKDTKEKNVLWRHDGWWNCYFGKLIDKESLNYFKEKIKEKQDIYEKIGISLTLSYRYAENGLIKEGIKVLKKTKFLLKLKIINILFKEKNLPYWVEIPLFIKSNFLLKIFYIFNIYYSSYSRYSLNINMFLYRAEKNPRKKLKIINKILKQNKFSRLFNKDTISKFYSSISYENKMYIRPQHILRLIEVRIDKYLLKPNDKLIEEIKYLFKLNFIYFSNYYYEGNGLIKYFIISETYFTLYYYLKNIVKKEGDERLNWIR